MTENMKASLIGSFISSLEREAKSFPQWESVDAVKLAFQSAFGGEHLITDEKASFERIREEMKSSLASFRDTFTPAGGDSIRLHLSSPFAKKAGAEVINRIFLSSMRLFSEIYPDILFFSSKSLSISGVISDPIQEENYIRSLMLENAKCSVFLCDSEKFDSEALYGLTTLENIDVCVFDKPYPELRTRCRILD